uniref:Uncharacterized protein n=1 Tax=Micrurus lemniscatus lemniscatus TaxID=129467 RepID=A0A2D4H753_MICLE
MLFSLSSFRHKYFIFRDTSLYNMLKLHNLRFEWSVINTYYLYQGSALLAEEFWELKSTNLKVASLRPLIYIIILASVYPLQYKGRFRMFPTNTVLSFLLPTGPTILW